METEEKTPGLFDRHICRIYYRDVPGMVKIGTCIADMVRTDKGLWLTENELSVLCDGVRADES